MCPTSSCQVAYVDYQTQRCYSMQGFEIEHKQGCTRDMYGHNTYLLMEINMPQLQDCNIDCRYKANSGLVSLYIIVA